MWGLEPEEWAWRPEGNSTEEHSTNVSADEINNPACSGPRLGSLLPLCPSGARSRRKGSNPFSPGDSGCPSSPEWSEALTKCGKWGIVFSWQSISLQCHPPCVLRRSLSPGICVLVGNGQGDPSSIFCWQRTPTQEDDSHPFPSPTGCPEKLWLPHPWKCLRPC